MKKRLSRELIWMALPAALLGGTAWWLGNGGKIRASTPSISQIVSNARRPSLSLQRVESQWGSPTQRALEGRDKGCEVAAYVELSTSWVQAQPANMPSLVVTDLVNEKGRSLKTVLGKKKRVLGKTTYSNISVGTGAGMTNNQVNYSVNATVPFFALPPTTRSATLIGEVVWGSARSLPVKLELIPLWMRRPSARLRLERVLWRPYTENKGGEVEVICRLANPHNPYIFGISKGAARYEPSFGIGYDPQVVRLSSRSSKDDTILAEWSQRIESGDGRLNSLDLLQKHIQKEHSKALQKNPALEPFLNSFDPLSKGPNVTINKDKIHLVYGVSRIPNAFKKPVFRCEIYLVNDGVVRVSCPLKTKPSS